MGNHSKNQGPGVNGILKTVVVFTSYLSADKQETEHGYKFFNEEIDV